MRNKATIMPAALLDRARDLVESRTGLYFPEARRIDLERGLRAAVRELGFEDPLSGVNSLLCSASQSQLEVFARHLTVGETYFFRDRKCFDFLEQRVLPELIGHTRATGRTLRVWSAGCCSGEEPYSLAILLASMIGDPREWNITILGTDINRLFLEKASSGIYGEWSFREVPAWVKERFFTRSRGNRFELLPEVKRRVRLTCHNLAENVFLPPPEAANVNLILCRNVLMYLTPHHRRDIVGRLKGCLAKGGWLIVGPSETSDDLFHEFEAVNFEAATLYRNTGGTAERTGAHRDAPLSRRPPAAVPPARSTAAWVKGRETVTTPVHRPPRENRAYAEGLGLYEKGLYREATEKLAPLLSDPSQLARVSVLLARISANQGNLSEAIGFCERAISAERVEPGHYYLRAIILEEQGKPEEATADLRRALYLDQTFVAAHLLLGDLARRGGKEKESARHFRNVLDLLRDRPDEEVIPWADGLTAGRLREIVGGMMGRMSHEG